MRIVDKRLDKKAVELSELTYGDCFTIDLGSDDLCMKVAYPAFGSKLNVVNLYTNCVMERPPSTLVNPVESVEVVIK